MSIRTTESLVKSVLGGNYNGRSSLATFSRVANSMVTRVLACASAKGTPLTATEAQDLETFLAAHLYCVQDALYTSRSTMSASGSRQQAPAGDGLKASSYGHAALAMDPSGCLASLYGPNRMTAGAVWLGTERNAQTTFDEREA